MVQIAKIVRMNVAERKIFDIEVIWRPRFVRCFDCKEYLFFGVLIF